MAESLVELILFAPEEEQGKLLAATIAHLGNAFLEKSGAIEGDSIMRADGDSGLASFLVLRKKMRGIAPRRCPVLIWSFRFFCFLL
jgi:hypothetical protein